MLSLEACPMAMKIVYQGVFKRQPAGFGIENCLRNTRARVNYITCNNYFFMHFERKIRRNRSLEKLLRLLEAQRRFRLL